MSKKVNPVTNPDNELCKQVLTEWEKGRTYVSDLDDLYEDLYRMLRGERPIKNYDWQSNIVINKVFQVIWTSIPYLAQKIFGATPLMGVRSYDKKGAWQREQILEFWHTMQGGKDSPHVSYFLVATAMLLRGLLNGVSFMKKTWHQKLLTKSVEEQVAVPMEMDEAGNETRTDLNKRTKSKTFPIEDFPYNQVVNNRDIVFDWDLQPGQSIKKGRFVIHRIMTDLDALYNSKIKYVNLDQLDPTMNTQSSELREDRSDLSSMDGLDQVPDSDFYTDVEIYERVGKFPVYNKKVNGEWIPCFDKEDIYTKKASMKDMIITIARGEGKEKNSVKIRFEKNPYEEINYIDLHVYFDAERWQSMGMAESIKDMQVAINDNINAMFDEIWQNLMPPVIVNKFSLWDWDTMQYAPQQRWLVGGQSRRIYYVQGRV